MGPGGSELVLLRATKIPSAVSLPCEIGYYIDEKVVKLCQKGAVPMGVKPESRILLYHVPSSQGV
jgi:hypothetical protein